VHRFQALDHAAQHKQELESHETRPRHICEELAHVHGGAYSVSLASKLEFHANHRDSDCLQQKGQHVENGVKAEQLVLLLTFAQDLLRDHLLLLVVPESSDLALEFVPYI
jgi:hypothetical protein